MIQSILPILQTILALGNICVIGYGFYKFLGRPHSTLEQRVAVLHLSTGNEVGVAIGPYWDGGAYTPPVTGKDVFYKDLSNIPGKAYMQHDPETGEMVLKADKIIFNTSAGEISVADIIAAIGGA